MTFNSIVVLFLISSYFPSQESDEYYIVFSKIDNEVSVYLNDSLTFNSGLVDGNPELEIRYELTELLKKGRNKIRIDLVNGSGKGLFKKDQSWEVFYEIFRNDDPIDFMNEKSKNGKTGLVYSMNHEIIIE